MVAMTSPAETSRVLRIAFDGDSVHGSLDDGGERVHPFFGWLELLAAIEALRADADDPRPAKAAS
jgi:hypothetical protein